jgi:hypothetical protein
VITLRVPPSSSGPYRPANPGIKLCGAKVT